MEEVYYETEEGKKYTSYETESPLPGVPLQ